MQELKYALKVFSYVIPIGITFSTTLYTVKKVDGVSMQPTFNPQSRVDDDDRLLRTENRASHKPFSDIVLLNRWVTRNFDLRVGDVVACKSVRDPRQSLIKRVIGLEGDWIRSLPSYDEDIVEVPKGYCWLEGDYKERSLDSNHFGPVPLGMVVGRADAIIWPPKRWSLVRRELDDETFQRIKVPISPLPMVKE
ncbi:mitochondrial inner membrane protease subunit 2-like [Brevipalpus obovatus]|uniref:mitochondrial inner membrane protease subunit 2-like n=1 Tax=Brevipalpus obovatus TaxID=246614 RepID=UPI003D9EB090